MAELPPPTQSELMKNPTLYRGSQPGIMVEDLLRQWQAAGCPAPGASNEGPHARAIAVQSRRKALRIVRGAQAHET